MSSDIERLQSASDLRIWEEDRAKSFVTWRCSSETLIAGIRTTIGLGAAQHQHIENFLRARSIADRAYAHALSVSKAEPPVPAKAPKAAAKEKAPAQECQPDPFIQAMSDIQAKVASARDSFATALLDGAMSHGLVATNEEFEKKTGALLTALDTGLAECVQANRRAIEAMAEYHRSSIEARKEDPPSDAWLVEHKYRRAVDAVRDRQRSFTAQLCTAVEEVWRLEEWREEMARKVLHRFCTKVFEVETTVQSLANDGIRALAGQRKEDAPSTAMLRELEKLLRGPPPPSGGNSASSTAEPKRSSIQEQPVATSSTGSQAKPKAGEWPVLLKLREQGHVGSLPPSVLAVMGAGLKTPRRWYGSQLAMVILTKDFWLHCFGLEVDPKGGQTGFAGMDADPLWSLYMPNATISQPTVKTRSIEIEEARRGFLGMKSTVRETLQADDDTAFQHWLTALQLAREKTVLKALSNNSGSKQTIATTLATEKPSARPPPPPPPPPPAPVLPQGATAETKLPHNSSLPRTAEANRGTSSEGNGDSSKSGDERRRSASDAVGTSQESVTQAVFSS